MLDAAGDGGLAVGGRVLFPVDPSRGLDAYAGWAPFGRWSGWMTPSVAASLPGIASGVQVITGQAMQMPLDDFRGVLPLPRPRLLEAPDPDESRAWFVQVQWADYLLEGNAVSYVTTWDFEGWPATLTHVPAAWVTTTKTPQGAVTPEGELLEPGIDYWVGGLKLDRDRVVHVKRGICSWAPWRGVGVVEQHFDALSAARDLHRYEKQVLSESSVPSVAVIAPNPRLGQEEADEAIEAWKTKYGGPTREPAILPNGTQIIPLSWSPADSQMNEARKLSLLDQANMLNLDGYWVGAPASSMTYRSPGLMMQSLMRRTIGPIAEVFEDIWSMRWVPRGRRIRFNRQAVVSDDMGTMVTTAKNAFESQLWSREEARAYMGLTPEFPVEGTQFVSTTSPVGTDLVDANDNGIPDALEDDQDPDDEQELDEEDQEAS